MLLTLAIMNEKIAFVLTEQSLSSASQTIELEGIDDRRSELLGCLINCHFQALAALIYYIETFF